MVAQFPRLDQVCDGEERAEHDADPCYSYVGDAEEGVLAAHYGARADYDGFCAAVFCYVEIYGGLVVWAERFGWGNVRWLIFTL